MAQKFLVTKCASCCSLFGPYSLPLTLLFTSFVVSLHADHSSDDHDLHGVNLHGDCHASLHDDGDGADHDVFLHDDHGASLCDACRQR